MTSSCVTILVGFSWSTCFNTMMVVLDLFIWWHLTKLPFHNSSPLSDTTHTYRKLLTPPTAPSDQNAPVGMATATLDDLQQLMPVGKICLPQTFAQMLVSSRTSLNEQRKPKHKKASSQSARRCRCTARLEYRFTQPTVGLSLAQIHLHFPRLGFQPELRCAGRQGAPSDHSPVCLPPHSQFCH